MADYLSKVSDLIQRLAESESARALLKSERDACREDRNQLEAERGDWTNIKCDTCKGCGENDNAMPCSQCAGEGRLWLTWKQQFDLSEAARLKAEGERDEAKRDCALRIEQAGDGAIHRRYAAAVGYDGSEEMRPAIMGKYVVGLLDAAEARLRDLVKAADRIAAKLDDCNNNHSAGCGCEYHSSIANYRRVRDAQPASPEPEASYIDIVFDGPPEHEAGRFVEVEGPDGRSRRVGKWIERENGWWSLRLPWSQHGGRDEK